MTTIAWDGATMAADKRANIGGVRLTITKIRRGRDGNLVGIAGAAALFEELFAWLCDGAPRPDAQSEKGDWAEVLEVDPEGRVWRHERLGRFLVEDRCYAIGSGGAVARAAMELGCDAAAAVRMAARFDTSTGDGIDAMPLHGPARRRRSSR